MNIELCKKCKFVLSLFYKEDDEEYSIEHDKVLGCNDDNDYFGGAGDTAFLTEKQKDMFVLQGNENCCPIDLNKNYDKNILSSIKILESCPYYAEHLIFDLNRKIK